MVKSVINPALRQPIASIFDGKADDLKSWRPFAADSAPKNDAIIDPNNGDFTCSTCEWTSPSTLDRDGLVDHFQSPWHVANARRRMNNRAAVDETRFEEEEDNASCDDASVSDSSDDEVETTAVYRRATEQYGTYALFVDGHSVQSVYKSFLGNVSVFDCHSRFWLISGIALLSPLRLRAHRRSSARRWTFRCKSIVHHKALHRYTTRAKQGGAQASRDAQQAHHAPKSAGAQLRRYNEEMLAKDIQALLVAWAPFLQSSHRIYLRCAAYQRRLFIRNVDDTTKDNMFLIVKQDVRLAGIPFVTRRPTHDECKRVHMRLTGVYALGDETAFRRTLDDEQERLAALNLNVNTAEVKSATRTKHALPSKDDIDRPEAEIEEDELKNAPRNKEKRNVVEISDVVAPLVSAADAQLIYTLVANGDPKPLSDFVAQQSAENASDMLTYMSVTKLGVHDQTMLHLAASKGLVDMVAHLLTLMCDPTVKDAQGKVAFSVAADKPTRRVFMQFRHDRTINSFDSSPHVDWNEAQIPVPPPVVDPDVELTAEEREKKEKTKQRKKERDKARKMEAKGRKKEEVEKERYLGLSDREKRALAAERRLQASTAECASSTPVLSRCFQCAVDITGKVPFEYEQYRFCKPACVKAHRAKTGRK